MMAADTELSPLARSAVKGLKGFYSRLQEAAHFLPDRPINPQAAMNVMKKAPEGISPEEVSYRKLDQFLTGRGNQPVTKQEILGHLEQNPIELKTTVHGTGPEVGQGTVNNPEFTTGQAKYSGYQLPGGTNYRETLIQLPRNVEDSWTTAVYPKRFPTEDAAREYYASHPEVGDIKLFNDPQPISPEYQSPHWDEPNVLTGMRANERALPTGEQGRLLENVQSDWHQSGASKGYQTPGVVDEAARLNQRYKDLGHQLEQIDYNIAQKYGDEQFSIDAVAERNALRAPIQAERHELRQLPDLAATGMVPDAPFKSSWPDLALKEQLYDAAEQNMDWVGVTPGSEMIKRGEGYAPPPPETGLTRADVVGDRVPRVHPNLPLADQPRFNDQELPNRLAKLLKPFGGGGLEHASLPLPERFTANISDVPMTEGSRSLQTTIARLPPAMRQAILKKGFPIMSLIGLMNSQPPSQPEP
jgi:hypothetical protein